MPHNTHREDSGPVGFWFLNDRLEPAVLDRQLDEFRDQGFSAVVLHPRDGLETPYLSEAWFQAVEHIMAGCKARGLKAWFYDENPFPSGSAGGKLLNRYPHLVGQRLAFHRMDVRPQDGHVYTPLPGSGRLLRVFAFLPDQADAYNEITRYAGLVADRWYVQGSRTQGYGPAFAEYPCHPHWRAWTDHESWTLDWHAGDNRQRMLLVVRVEPVEDSHHGFSVDLLAPETTRRFIELTHEETLQRLGAERFREFAAAFMDEPHLGVPFPWTDRLPEEYEKAFQTNLLDLLPHLTMQIDGTSPQIRCQYRRLLGRLWKANFMEPMSRWCQDHGIPLTGHISPEEDPILMTLQAPGWPEVISHLDWPGYDLVLSPFGPAEPANMLGPKLVASLAHQHGSPHLMTECLACGGEDLTIGAMKRTIDWLAVFGFDKYVIHGQFYSLDGHRKREAPPSIFYQSPYWQHFHVLSDHIRAISEWNSAGTPIRPLAVLLPLSTFMAWLPVENSAAIALAQHLADLCGRLMAAGLDFDFVTDQDLAGAVVRQGQKEFRIGQAAYQALIVPAVPIMETPGLRAIERLQEAGIPIESFTSAIRAIGPSDPGVAFSEPAPLPEILLPRLIEAFRSWVRFPSDQKLYAQSRRINGQVMRWVWNPSDDPIDLYTKGGTLTLEPWQTRLLDDAAPVAAEPAFRSESIARFEGPWSLTPQEPNTLVLKRWQLQTADGQVHLVCLPARTGSLPWGLDHQTVTLWTELIVDGPLPEAQLWFDRSTFAGPYELRVNASAVGRAEPVRRHDIHERRVQIGHLLTPGTNRFEVKIGPIQPGEAAMLDPIRLTGEFQVIRTDQQSTSDAADVRPDWYKSLCADDPNLARVTPSPSSRILKQPSDWTTLGFPHYSGAMVYSATLRADKLCGPVFLEAPASQRDSFEVLVNGVRAGTCGWSPFRLDISPWLKAGENAVEIIVANTSINRTEARPQPSGLVGPMQIRTFNTVSRSPERSSGEPSKKPYRQTSPASGTTSPAPTIR